MKKSNWIITAIAVVVSAFLLCLWYYLGFNKVDDPYDLVLSIIWWIVIALAVFLIFRVEKKRREAIRTIYVSPGKLFNSEAGIVEYDMAEGPVATMQRLLDDQIGRAHV